MNNGQMDRGNENPTQPWWLRKTTKKSQSGWSAPGFEPGTSRMRVSCVTTEPPRSVFLALFLHFRRKIRLKYGPRCVCVCVCVYVCLCLYRSLSLSLSLSRSLSRALSLSLSLSLCVKFWSPPNNFQTSYPIDRIFWLHIASYRNCRTPLNPFLNFENCAREKILKLIFSPFD